MLAGRVGVARVGLVGRVGDGSGRVGGKGKFVIMMTYRKVAKLEMLERKNSMVILVGVVDTIITALADNHLMCPD